MTPRPTPSPRDDDPDFLSDLLDDDADAGVDIPDTPVFELDEHSSISNLQRVLDEAVVGQERGKGRLSVLLSLHLATFRQDHSGNPIPNAVLIGPTGVGKTHSLRSLAESFALPFVVLDSTSLTQAGIVGLQLEDIAELLFEEASRILSAGGYDDSDEERLHLAERGVVVFDEFDKLATPEATESSADASRRQVQRRLLKFAEGSKVRVGLKHSASRTLRRELFIDTSNLLLIASGAFADLSTRTAGKRVNSELYRELFGESAVVAEDVQLYGFMPELVARFPLVIEYERLGARALLEILARSADSPLRIWEQFAEVRGYQLSVQPQALAVLASRAARLGIGARGLQQLLFPYLSEQFRLAAANGETNIDIAAEDLEASGPLYASSPEAVDADGQPSPESPSTLGANLQEEDYDVN